MVDKILYFIMIPMVYISIVMFASGVIYSIIKILTAPKQLSTLKIFPEKKPVGLLVLYDTFLMPTIRKDSPLFWIFLMLYHLAFGFLILSHLDMIPGLNIIDTESPHMIGHGAIGLILTMTLIYFILRRLRSPIREISVLGDYLLLFLLLFIIVSGDIISWSNSWSAGGFVLGKSDFKNYMRILTEFSFADPRDVLDSSHYIVVAFHVFLANLFLMIFPFTKLMHTFFSIPINKIRRG